MDAMSSKVDNNEWNWRDSASAKGAPYIWSKLLDCQSFDITGKQKSVASLRKDCDTATVHAFIHDIFYF